MNSCMNSRKNLRKKSKQKKNFVQKFSEIRARIFKNEKMCAQILNKERNLCTNLNKPTEQHQDRDSKTSSFCNYLISLKSKSIKIMLKVSTYSYVW